jgi:hypothetical protein
VLDGPSLVPSPLSASPIAASTVHGDVVLGAGFLEAGEVVRGDGGEFCGSLLAGFLAAGQDGDLPPLGGEGAGGRQADAWLPPVTTAAPRGVIRGAGREGRIDGGHGPVLQYRAPVT